MATTNGKATTQGPSSKIDAVRQAWAALGKDAKAMQIKDEVQQRFGITMTVDHVYNCMSEIRRQNKKKRGPTKNQAKQPVAATASAGTQAQPAAASKQTAAKSSGVEIDDIATAKQLVARIGAGRLKSLIDVLAS